MVVTRCGWGVKAAGSYVGGSGCLRGTVGRTPVFGLQLTGDHYMGKPSATVSQLVQLSLSSFRGR